MICLVAAPSHLHVSCARSIEPIDAAAGTNNQLVTNFDVTQIQAMAFEYVVGNSLCVGPRRDWWLSVRGYLTCLLCATSTGR